MAKVTLRLDVPRTNLTDNVRLVREPVLNPWGPSRLMRAHDV